MQPKNTLKAYALSAVFGATGGFITIAMIALLDLITNLVWETGMNMQTDTPTRTLAVFPIMIGVGLVVGLLVKRFGKVDGLDGVLADVLTKGKINWKRVPLAVINSILSIGSGASLGPEAPSAVVSAGAASLVADKSGASQATSTTMSLGSMSGMLGGLLGAPFLTPAMIAEAVNKKMSDLSRLLICSMIASAFGVGVVIALIGHVFTIDLGLPAYTGSNISALLWAFLFGVGGALGGVLIYVVSKAIVAPVMKAIKAPVAKATLGGLVMAIVAFALPLTMFSGQDTIPHLIQQSAEMSVIALLVLAVAKMISTSVLIETGFFGGGIFPAIFAGAAFGLAFDHWLGISATLAVPATIAGLMTVIQRKPFTAALLTVAITGTVTAPGVAVAVAGASLVGLVIAQKLPTTD